MDMSYFEETVSELVMEAVRDEMGAITTPAVYQDVVQTRARSQSVGHDDLTRIINKRPDAPHLNRMIDLAQESAQWRWFDRYQDHLARAEEIGAWNTLNPEDLREAPTAPVRPPIISATQWRLNNYSTLRGAAYGSWQQQLELVIGDLRNGTANSVVADDIVRAKHKKPTQI